MSDVFDRIGGTGRSIGRVIALPVWGPRLVLQERRWDREHPVGSIPTTYDAIKVVLDDPDSLDRALVADAMKRGDVSCAVVPLSDLSRIAAARQMATKLTSTPEGLQNLFVTMSPVYFDSAVTEPVDGFHTEELAALSERLRLVPGGFVTDYASIPSIATGLVGHPTGSYNRAAIVHDWAYAKHGDRSSQGRKDCDTAMLRLMAQDGTRPWRRSLIYVALRIGGGLAFASAQNRRQQLDAVAVELLPLISEATTQLFTFQAGQLELFGLLPPGTQSVLETEIRHRGLHLAALHEAHAST